MAAPNRAAELNRLDPRAAWQPWKPRASQPWNVRWIAHLYRRAAFSPSWQDVTKALQTGLEATLTRLLHAGPGLEEFDELVDESTRGLASNSRNASLSEYQAVWLYRMLHTPHPLGERLTLFWHNHFATSIAKVRQPALMQQQNALLRRYALGSFRTLLLEMSRDPAMLLWLDSNSNVKGKPNENFARELMELFSLGVGHYTEKDVQEAARAFTGWHTAGGEFVVNPAQHDAGSKTVFGKTGDWDGGDIVRLVLELPEAARFLARKLYREFISEELTPPDALLEPLAEELRRADYEVRPVIAVILRSQHFFSEFAYRQRVKSPVEYVIGLIRSVSGSATPSALADTLEGMGQSLFAPPTVKGWEGGKAWLNSATLLARYNMAWSLLGGENPSFRQKISPAEPARKFGGSDPAEQASFLIDLFVQGDLDATIRRKLTEYLRAGPGEAVDPDTRLRELAHLVVLLPEYHLA